MRLKTPGSCGPFCIIMVQIAPGISIATVCVVPLAIVAHPAGRSANARTVNLYMQHPKDQKQSNNNLGGCASGSRLVILLPTACC